MSRTILFAVLVSSILILTLGCPPAGENNTAGSGDTNGAATGGDGDDDNTGGGSDAELVFSAQPDNEREMVARRSRDIEAYLEHALGIEVAFRVSSDYTAQVTNLVNGETDLGWFGGLAGVEAREQCDARAIAQREGDARFKSVFIARADDESIPDVTDNYAEFVAALAGKTFSFGSEKSTSGRLMPQYFLQNTFGMTLDFRGSDPTFAFSGSHPTTAVNVASGAADVGSMNINTWARAEAGEIEGVEEGSLRAVWTTPDFYDYNWSVRDDVEDKFGAGFIERLRTAILAIDGENDDEEIAALENKILEAFQTESFIAAETEMYDSIKSVAVELGMIPGN